MGEKHDVGKECLSIGRSHCVHFHHQHVHELQILLITHVDPIQLSNQIRDASTDTYINMAAVNIQNPAQMQPRHACHNARDVQSKVLLFGLRGATCR